MPDAAVRLAAARLPSARPHQQRALEAFDSHAQGRRFHFVMPPGSGKTLLGSLIGQRLGRPVVVLVPNTAIQAQWLALWRAAGAVRVGSDRDLRADVTVLTYQSIATFDEDAEGPGLARLHPNAQAAVAALRARPLTLVLDEAHHLAAVWGQVLADILDEAQASVVALTATPRQALSPGEAALADELFGPVLFEVSTPALVRDEVLAPYRELPWFVTPTPTEADYLRASAQRWQELLTAAMAPDFGPVGFLGYIDEAWVRHENVSWAYIERNRPEVARAVLRLSCQGLCELPQGARVRDEHRVPMQVEDWVALLADYGCTVLAEPEQPGWQRLRVGLRSLGWTLTTRGARKGQSSLDKVLSRSRAKAVAAGYLVAQEALIRGPDLRAVVLTDFENAQSTPASDLRSVLAGGAGSAWEALAQVQASNPTLRVALMTGGSVGGLPEVLEPLAPPGVTVKLHDDGLARLVGSWGPRQWVPVVTAAFQAGQVDVLVGTRGLLGEGWDAPAANVLIDLTAATTATAVVQVRGRAIRRDPARADKVAHIWSVCCVADEHPRGDLDYRRLVTKHRGYLAPDDHGVIVAGAQHLDPRCGPFAPPDQSVRDAINADALVAAGSLDATRAAWRPGMPYRDVVQTAVRVTVRRDLGVPQTRGRSWPGWPAAATLGAAALGSVAAAAAQSPPPVVGACATAAGATGLVVATGWRSWRRRRLASHVGADGMLLAFGQAVAESLREASAAQVEVAPDGQGSWVVSWPDADQATSAEFARAVAQILAPIDYPRYVISRRFGGRAVMWHAVPDVFGVNKAGAERFLDSWRRFVSTAEVLYTGSPQGAGVATAVRGADPMLASSALSAQWS